MELTPSSIAFFATSSAAMVAANGVLFLDPLNPLAPELHQARALPSRSVIVMMVLLNVALMWATPTGTFLRNFFFPFFLGVAIAPPDSRVPRGLISRRPYFFVASFSVRWYGCAALSPEAPCGAAGPGRTRGPSGA